MEGNGRTAMLDGKIPGNGTIPGIYSAGNILQGLSYVSR